MNWATIRWRSELLEKDTTMQVLLPHVGTPPYPTLYLLHSLKDDSTAWLRRTQLECLVERYPVMVVMPDGYRSFYTDHAEGPPFARHIGEEVPAFIERNFPARRERTARAIGGASMGGYGALRVGLGYPEKFCSIHSSAGSLDRRIEFGPSAVAQSEILKHRPPSFIAEMRRIFGERPAGTQHDVLTLAEACKARSVVPNIWIDCGTSDPLLSATRNLHQEFEAASIPHHYAEYEGTHGWEYCAARLSGALQFHFINLGITAT